MNRRLATVAASLLLLAATVATAGPASAAPASAGELAAVDDFGPVSVRGGGSTVLTAAFQGFEGDPVQISVDARAATNTDPRSTTGHFHVRHVHTDGRLVADFEGDITCLAGGGREAIATGVITKGEAPWFPGTELAGTKVALSVEDNGRHGDRMGWVWGVFGQPISDCQGTVPFIRTTGGDFSVRG
ncbi:hypothetical protein [Streptomyces sp. 1331.2]|uniref:hypothetical protein n=1 Tax=Streptomyces sp. 1331.2 TaxID=1938835 RepID=UPI000BD8F19E|nr:hypothetical protein [Streptomyces sp. 1331.2]SOB80053.1 hypothetical protein SAMN06272789_0745 [Streptomyces sp. 1331.2]